MNRKLYLLMAIIMIVSVMFTACAGEGEAKYPERAINLIVPFGAGGGTDGWNRAIAAALEEEMGWTVKVSNLTGGSAGSTGTAKVWTSDHDGYTLAGTSETPLTIPVMTGDEQTAKDWEYYIAGGSPGVLCVNKDAGISDLQDLIDQANAAPEEIKIAGTSGGLWFLLANLLGEYGDVPLGVVTYDGSAGARDACVKGETAAVAASAGEVAEYIKSGDLIAIAAFQTEDFSHPDFGTVPAVTSLVPAVEAYLPLNQFIGFMVPQDTQDDVKATLEEAFLKACDSDTLKTFAEENYAVFYKLTGDEAQEMCIKAQSVMSWMLYNMDKTEYSPADFDIPEP